MWEFRIIDFNCGSDPHHDIIKIGLSGLGQYTLAGNSRYVACCFRKSIQVAVEENKIR